MAAAGQSSADATSVVNPPSMMGELLRLMKHSAVYGIGNIVSKMVGLLLIPVYTHCLSPEAYGIIELLDLTLSFIAMFVGMGLTSAVLRFYFDTKDKEERNCIVSTALIFISVVSIFVVLLGVLFDDQLSLLLFKTNGRAFFFDLMIITFFFSGLIEIPLVMLRAQERSVVFSAVTVLRLVLALSLNIYFIVFAGWGVTGFLVSNLTTSVTVSMILVVATLGKSRIRFSFSHLKRMMLFGLPLIPSSLGMFWINFGDRFVLKHSHTDWDVGIYSLGYKFAMMISFLLGQPFFLIWSTRMYTVMEEKDGEKTYARICTYFATVVIFGGLCLALVIPDVVRIVVSPNYLQAHLVVPIIALGYVFRELSDFFRGILFVGKKPGYVGLIVTVTTVVCTGLYLVLIPLYGVFGAGLATCLTFLFMALAMLFYANRVRAVPYEFGRLLTLLLAAGGIYFAFRTTGFENPYLSCCFKFSASLLFLPLLYVLGFFTQQEKDKLRVIARKASSKIQRRPLS